MPLSAGDKLGHFEILSLLGKGGMGEVYRAKDTKLKRDVALKVLPEAFARDAERMGRFQREAEVLASLNHSNIAAIYGVEDRALVMELVEGSSPKGPLPFEEAWKIVSQIVAALEYAHERGIMHRDLKPANILVTSEGVVKLLDFGLAKAFTNQREPSASPENSPTLTLGATEVGMILGTAAYMAPEQARGKAVDKRADIWSFGVVLYELLTGERRLFEGEDVGHTLAAVIMQEPDLSGAPAQVQPLLKRCLEKDPKKRLRDIGDVELLLDPAHGAVPQAAPAPHKWLWPGMVAVFALTLIAALALWALWRLTQPVDHPLIRLDASLGPDAIAGADAGVAISPDGTRIVFPIYLKESGSGAKQMLATRILNQTAITPLPGTENGRNVFFSPDSEGIGFNADGKLKKISLRGGAQVTLADSTFLRGASWGENGDIVASLSAGALQSVPAAGGSPQQMTNLSKEVRIHLWPQILPGGNAVLFTASDLDSSFEEAKIEVVSLKTGAVKMLLSGAHFGRYLPTNGSTGHLVYVHQGALYAVAFDPVRLEVRGSPEPILEDVADKTGFTGNLFDASGNGTFVYHTGIATDQKWPIVLLDSSGKTELLLTTPGNYTDPPIFSRWQAPCDG